MSDEYNETSDPSNDGVEQPPEPQDASSTTPLFGGAANGEPERALFGGAPTEESLFGAAHDVDDTPLFAPAADEPQPAADEPQPAADEPQPAADGLLEPAATTEGPAEPRVPDATTEGPAEPRVPDASDDTPQAPASAAQLWASAAAGGVLFAADRDDPTLPPLDEAVVDEPLFVGAAPIDEPLVAVSPGPEPAPAPSDQPTVSMDPVSGDANEPSSEVTDAELAALAVPAAAAASMWAELSPDRLDSPGAAQPTLPGMGIPRDLEPVPEEGPRWWIWALVGLGALIVIVALGYAVWWSAFRTVVVPGVIGKDPATATKVLYEVGLTLGKVTDSPTSAAPAGTVLSQTPKAGTSGRPGDPVALVIAVEPDQTAVPSVIGKTAEQAQEELAAQRLLPVVVRSYNATTAADYVFSQLPTASAELPPGSSVAIMVSRGPAPANATVPKVTGLNESEATRLLEAANLSVASYRSYSASVPVGEVYVQTPSARTQVPYGATVQILVSQGPGVTPVTVPNVVGKAQGSATTALKAAQLQPKVRYSVSASVASGTVIAQTPPAGSRTAAGAVVGVLVSSGQLNRVAVPSVVGTASVSATATVIDAGLRPVVVEVALAGVAPGVVGAQFPAAGADYPRGFPVILLVSKD